MGKGSYLVCSVVQACQEDTSAVLGVYDQMLEVCPAASFSHHILGFVWTS